MTDSMREVSRTPSGGVSLRPRGSLAGGRVSLFGLAIASGKFADFLGAYNRSVAVRKGARKTPWQAISRWASWGPCQSQAQTQAQTRAQTRAQIQAPPRTGRPRPGPGGREERTAAGGLVDWPEDTVVQPRAIARS